MFIAIRVGSRSVLFVLCNLLFLLLLSSEMDNERLETHHHEETNHTNNEENKLQGSLQISISKERLFDIGEIDEDLDDGD